MKKKSKIKKLDEKVFSAMKFLKISDNEIRTYAILISLGHADLQMLNRVMKLKQGVINNTLDLLVKRNWAKLTDGFYKPINPTKVIKDAIYKFKKDIRRNIERIKKEAMVDLETLFEQNNLMYVRYKEYLDQILYKEIL